MWKDLDHQVWKSWFLNKYHRPPMEQFSVQIIPWDSRFGSLTSQSREFFKRTEVYAKILKSAFLNLEKMAKSGIIPKWPTHNSGWTSLFFGPAPFFKFWKNFGNFSNSEIWELREFWNSGDLVILLLHRNMCMREKYHLHVSIVSSNTSPKILITVYIDLIQRYYNLQIGSSTKHL